MTSKWDAVFSSRLLALIFACLLSQHVLADQTNDSGPAVPLSASEIDVATLPPDLRDPTAEERPQMDALDEAIHKAFAESRLDDAEEGALALLKAESTTWGPNHPWTAGTRRFLARIFEERGDLPAAVGEYKSAHEIAYSRLGPDHKMTRGLAEDIGFAAFGMGMGAAQDNRWSDAEAAFADSLSFNEASFAGDNVALVYSLDALASALVSQGRHREAAPYRRRAYEMQARMAGPDDPQTLTMGEGLGLTLADAEMFDEAAAVYREVVAGLTRMLGSDHPDTLRVLNNLAVALYRGERPTEALPLGETLVAIRTAKLGFSHPDTLLSLDNLSVTLDKLDRKDEALEVRRRLLDGQTSALGPEHPDTLAAMDNVGLALEQLGRSAEAAEMFGRAADIRTRTLGPDHAGTLRSMSQRALSMANAGDPQSAETLDRQVLARREAVLGPDHKETLVSLNNLAVDLSALGKYSESETLHRRAFETRLRTLGPDDPQTLTSIANLAVVMGEQGRHAEAETFDRRALDARQRVLGPDDPDTLRSLSNLGNTLNQLGRFGEAEPLLADAVARHDRVLGKNNLRTAAAYFNLGTALHGLGRYTESAVASRRALETRSVVLGPDHPDTLQSEANLAITLTALGQMDEAETLARKALAGQERRFGADHPQTINALQVLSTILAGRGRNVEAALMARRAWEISERTIGAEHPGTLMRLANLALLVPREEGEGLAREAMELSARNSGENHANTINIATNLAFILDELGRNSEAEMLKRQMLERAREALGRSHPDTARLTNNLATSLDNSGHYDEAATLYAEAADAWKGTYGAVHPETLIAVANEANVLLKAGRALDALQPARDALAGWLSLQGSASGAHQDTRTQRNAETRSAGWRLAKADWSAATQDGIEVRPLFAEAFEAIQAIGLDGAADAMARSAARIAAGENGLEDVVRIWEDARERRDRLDAELARHFGQSGENQTGAEVAILSREREKAQADVVSATAELKEKFPRFFELVVPGPLAVTELQGEDGLLRDSEALILLAPGQGNDPGFVYAVNRHLAAWARIPIPAQVLSNSIVHLHSQLDGGSGTRAAVARNRTGPNGFDRTEANALYDALFGAPQIREVIEGKEDWILSPQGTLLSLPFNALVTSKPEGADTDPIALRATPWLGLQRAISVLPSVAMIRSRSIEPVAVASARGQEGDTDAFFGLGDPAFSGGEAAPVLVADASLTMRSASERKSGVRGLPALPGTRAEVEAIAALFGPERSTVVLGAQATESRLMAESASGNLRRASTVLLATHGLIAGTFDSLAEPALALAPPLDGQSAQNGADWEDDGLLTASEAARLDLDADWVILSACDTAAGSGPDASGLSGLARGFFYAGARSLLVSHWKVQDDATARLTTGAIRQTLADPTLDRARAFRDSMADIVADTGHDGTSLAFSHPSVWAPFQIIGVH